MINKNFLLAVSVLIGTIVGAGIFGLPYVVAKSGLITSFFYFLVLGGAVLLIHLFFAEIVLRTREKYRLVGYSQKYLGNPAKLLAASAVILGTVGSLLAFLIIAGDFLKILFSHFSDISNFQLTLIFGITLSFFVFKGLKIIAPVEIFTNLFFFLIIFLVIFFSLPKIDFANFPSFNLPEIFLPYGVILFSLVGWTAIPEMAEIFKDSEEKRKIKKAIILSSVIVIILYLVFALSVVGVSGNSTSPDSLSGLIPFLGEKIIFFGALAGVITLADSFLILALYLRNTFIFDFKIAKFLSSFLAVALPLLLFLIGFRSFIGTIGFVGTILGAIEGALIILIYKKAKTFGNREPEYSLKIPSFVLLYFLIPIFILGAVLQFIL